MNEIDNALRYILSRKINNVSELDEEGIFQIYYVFCRYFGYVPFEEFLNIKFRILYELMTRLSREMSQYSNFYK